MASFSLLKSTKIASKIDLERHRFFDRFWHRFFLHFGSILGPKLGPCWPLFRHKTPSRPTKKASKMNPNAQNGPKYVLDLFRSPPDLDFSAPGPFCSRRPDFGAPRPQFLKVLGLFLCYITPLLHCYFVTLLLCLVGLVVLLVTAQLWLWHFRVRSGIAGIQPVFCISLQT